MIAHALNMCAPYILCTFDNIFEIVELTHYNFYTTFGSGAYIVLFVCNLLSKQISFLYIQTLHNDCSHIEDVHRRRRSRSEFGIVLSCNHKNARDTVVLLTTNKSAAVVVWTFSSDLTLSA